jgi:hypothetical protein
MAGSGFAGVVAKHRVPGDPHPHVKYALGTKSLFYSQNACFDLYYNLRNTHPILIFMPVA